MKRLLAIAAIAIASATLAAPSAHAGYWSRYYASGPVQGETRVTVVAGQSANLTLKFLNKGYYRWRGGPTGWRHVSLYSVSPYARKSQFADASWLSPIQPAALWESRVESGEIGSFRFSVRAPSVAGTYVEKFHMAVEDTAWVDGGDVAITFDVVAPGTEAAASAGVSVNARAYVVMDSVTGEVLAEKRADEVRSIASMTKLMTVMVARESGLSESLMSSVERGDEVGGGRLRVAYGTAMTVRELVASAIIGSANNAANAIARSTGLSREEFIRRMDAKAAALGMTHSSFADPTGIDVENLSTAREVALMGKAAFSDPWIAPFAATAVYDVATSAGPHTIKNTNKLVSDSSLEVVGGKTGFINEAGYTLVTRLKRVGAADVIVAVLGCDTSLDTFRDAKALAEWTWSKGNLAIAR